MNDIETMLSKKIKETDPTLDINGADHKVFQIACQDLANYLRYMNWSGMDKETSILSKLDKISIFHRKEKAELECFLSYWTHIWLEKWNKRINLLIGNNDKIEPNHSDKQTKGNNLWKNLECREEMIWDVVVTLIKHSEICGTQIIAENILKNTIAEKDEKDIQNVEQLLSILTSALTKARRLSQTIGPLISIKIDKGYYCQGNC
jgi:hypothetical protein